MSTFPASVSPARGIHSFYGNAIILVPSRDFRGGAAIREARKTGRPESHSPCPFPGSFSAFSINASSSRRLFVARRRRGTEIRSRDSIWPASKKQRRVLPSPAEGPLLPIFCRVISGRSRSSDDRSSGDWLRTRAVVADSSGRSRSFFGVAIVGGISIHIDPARVAGQRVRVTPILRRTSPPLRGSSLESRHL